MSLALCLRLLTVTFALACAALPAHAEDGSASAGDIKISGAWTRPTIGSSTQGVIYLTISNAGKSDDRLTGLSTPAAATAELHTMTMDGGMMKMRAIASLLVPAGKSVELSPGGDHVMLSGIVQPLRAGDHIDLKLSFEKAGDVSVSVPVSNQ